MRCFARSSSEVAEVVVISQPLGGLGVPSAKAIGILPSLSATSTPGCPTRSGLLTLA